MNFEDAWKELDALKYKVREKHNWSHAQISIDTMMVAMIMTGDINLKELE